MPDGSWSPAGMGADFLGGRRVRGRLQAARRRVANTPYQVLTTDGLMQLRRYGSAQATTGQLPVLLVPPLMAPSFVFDLHERRSMIRFLLARGHTVYLVDWGPPGPAHRHIGVQDYVLDWLATAVHRTLQDAGTAQLTLAGYCLGGLFCCWYAASSDAHRAQVAKLAVVASPTDTFQMGALVDFAKHFRGPAAVAGEMIGNVPGWISATAFQATAPVSALTRWFKLPAKLRDEDALLDFVAMRAWMKAFMALPQEVYRQLLHELIVGNLAYRSRFELTSQAGRRHRVDLGRLDMPIFAAGGKQDKIVAPEAVHAIASVVSSERVTCIRADGGHASVVSGAAAPSQLWAPLSDWLTAPT